MPVIEWSVNATVRSDVQVVYEAESGKEVDVSGKTGKEVAKMLNDGTHLVSMSDHYDGLDDIEHSDFVDVDGFIAALDTGREG